MKMSIPQIDGFSKLSKEKKIDWLSRHCFIDPSEAVAVIQQYWNSNEKMQQLHDEFIENAISNFYLPLGIAPNFIINDKVKVLPMVIEESSVVAAASNAAKFWAKRGGFKAEVMETEKIGHVHFCYRGDKKKLQDLFNVSKDQLLLSTDSITSNMRKRGGGITELKLIDKTAELPNYYQLAAHFETVDSMGANFINSCLEQFAKTWKSLVEHSANFVDDEVEIVMSILSNYVPNCLVRAWVSCPIHELADTTEDSLYFYEKFSQAIAIAEIEPYRAVTHNKGVMNGIDAVAIASGNDFRAIEAGVHAYAAKNGRYTSLTHVHLEDEIFTFSLEIPLAVGTVGGLTNLHPLVRWSHELMGKPNAKELMEIMAVAGLAQNFAALKSLTTIGIQQGHMKMHLLNILNQFSATDVEKEAMISHFKSEAVSYSAVEKALNTWRNQ